MMSFMITSCVGFAKQKSSPHSRHFSEGCVAEATLQGWLGFPWPLCLKRVGLNLCYAPLADTRLVVAGRAFRPRGGANRSERGAGCAAPSAARPGLDAGASGDGSVRRLQGRKTAAARGRSGERLPSGAHPRGPGHGKPSTVFRSAAHSPASERPLGPPWERSDARGAWGHVATTGSARHRQRLIQHARAPPVPRHVQGRRPRSASTAARSIRHPPARQPDSGGRPAGARREARP